MTNIPEVPAISFIDNPHAPDVFADAVAGWNLLGGCVRLTFVSSRVNHMASPGPTNNVVIGRLVMPIDMAENMARETLGFIERQRAIAASPPQSGFKTVQ